ncbi:hypothetical protein SAMN05660666_02642 [Novosphingobium aromaticivorans]|uniref:hypothetical protein n=1 Tax=Novosphingobium aromaticivorans TaxID=48935 RepID=UPI0002FF1879|nr:hypothetical protein [Novosphingobium aromaticivorans]SCY71522.1 hypothetical protein SAMN05660666_02642 [Novosphingobium aromaticivorans]
MIEARADTAGLARRLEDKARTLATARAAMAARPNDARRWRVAGLLWPLFGKE